MNNIGRAYIPNATYQVPRYSSFLIVVCIVIRYLDGEERVGCFAGFVFLVSHDVCVSLPRGAMGLSAVCDSNIYLSLSLQFWFWRCFTIYGRGGHQNHLVILLFLHPKKFPNKS